MISTKVVECASEPERIAHLKVLLASAVRKYVNKNWPPPSKMYRYANQTFVRALVNCLNTPSQTNPI